MDNCYIAVCGENLPHIFYIAGIAYWIQAGGNVDVTAHAPYLLVVITGLRLVREKIELQHVAVYPTIIIHEHRLNARSVHVADRMQYSNHSYHLNEVGTMGNAEYAGTRGRAGGLLKKSPRTPSKL